MPSAELVSVVVAQSEASEQEEEALEPEADSEAVPIVASPLLPVVLPLSETVARRQGSSSNSEDTESQNPEQAARPLRGIQAGALYTSVPIQTSTTAHNRSSGQAPNSGVTRKESSAPRPTSLPSDASDTALDPTTPRLSEGATAESSVSKDVAKAEATSEAPATSDRVTLRFREQAQSLAASVASPEESKGVARESKASSQASSESPAISNVESADTPLLKAPPAPSEEMSSAAPHSVEIAPKASHSASESRSPAPAEPRIASRVSVSTTAAILDKQASASVRTVSIRLPIEDGSRAASSLQIEVARRNSLLEVRLAGSSDGLQRAVSESIDSLVQKLSVDRWTLDSPTGTGPGSESGLLPKMESILPESSELGRPSFRLPSQEIATLARELPLDPAATSASQQQTPDGQRQSDFQQEAGSRQNSQQNPQQNSQQSGEEQRRPRREAWNQFLQDAEASFDSGLLETASELQ